MPEALKKDTTYLSIFFRVLPMIGCLTRVWFSHVATHATDQEMIINPKTLDGCSDTVSGRLLAVEMF